MSCQLVRYVGRFDGQEGDFHVQIFICRYIFVCNDGSVKLLKEDGKITTNKDDDIYLFVNSVY